MGMLLNLIRSPKVLGALAVVLVVGALGVHHKLVLNERDRLRDENIALEANLETARANQRILEDALDLEREAAAVATAERDEARRAIDKFRAGRRDDPEALEWAAQPLPLGELERLCVALPEMDGCQPAIEQ